MLVCFNFYKLGLCARALFRGVVLNLFLTACHTSRFYDSLAYQQAIEKLDFTFRQTPAVFISGDLNQKPISTC